MIRLRFRVPHPATVLLFALVAASATFARPAAPQPLYRDPVYDGAADPVVIWNPHTTSWWMFYTNRRANVPGLSGVAWVHGTPIGIAESRDRGVTWTRLGDAAIALPAAISGDPPTLWAPEVLTAPDGTHHMFLTVVPGVFENWQHPRRLVHLTSTDLLHWSYAAALDLASDRVIDAGVARLPDGTWRMWYNNERDHKSIYYADSPDLFTWTDQGKVSGVGERPGEGPYVFQWQGAWWMLVDLWRGLGVYRSDDQVHWTVQPDNLLQTPGHGPDDGVIGGHPGVVVCGDRAYLFYFTHPGRTGTLATDRPDALELRRSSIQVTELHLDATGLLSCDRDVATFIDLIPPAAATAATATDATTLTTQAFAGSSINAPPGFNQSLVSDDRFQFAGYYAPDGAVRIARRDLPRGAWTTFATPFSGNPADAHNTIALGLDGAGALHVAWGHHNVPLNYARAPAAATAAPVIFDAPTAMVGRNETRVTYPQFFRLPDGDLLFTFRDGGSGNGNLVLNRYSPTSRTWRRVQENLLDGQGERSAYPTACVDDAGTLHLAWTWRETPDVASNHDLLYARSADGGETWTNADGRRLMPPFDATAEAYVARIPTHSTLMNPPLVVADERGRPLLADYWAEPGAPFPTYHVLRHDHGIWRRYDLPGNATPFTLAGGGTKHPPLSRCVVFATGSSLRLIHRHDGFGRAALQIATPDLDAATPDWAVTVLPPGDLGAWEPTADAFAWQHRRRAELLVSQVSQRDGDDQVAAAVPATTIQLLTLP